MKIIMVRTYEITVPDLDSLTDLARTWSMDEEEADQSLLPDDDWRVESLTHAIDGGDLSDMGAVSGHSIIYANPNIN